MELTEQFRRMDSALAGMPEVEIPKMLAALARKYNAAEGLVKVLNGAHEGGKKKRSAKSTAPGSKRLRTSSRDTLAEGDTIELNDSSAAHPIVILHRYDVIEKAWKLRTPDGTVLNGVYKRHSAWRVVPQQPQPPVQPQQQPPPQVLLLGYNGAEQEADEMAELVDPEPEADEGEEEDLFCTCQRPAAGTMVACDGDACPYSWFHESCLDTLPDTDLWLCNHCAQTVPPATPSSSSSSSSASASASSSASSASASASATPTAPVVTPPPIIRGAISVWDQHHSNCCFGHGSKWERLVAVDSLGRPCDPEHGGGFPEEKPQMSAKYPPQVRGHVGGAQVKLASGEVVGRNAKIYWYNAAMVVGPAGALVGSRHGTGVASS